MKYIKDAEELLLYGIEQSTIRKQHLKDLKAFNRVLNMLEFSASMYAVDSDNRIELDTVEVNSIGGEWKLQVIFKSRTK